MSPIQVNLSAHTPSLEDFEQAVKQADQQRHTEIKLNKRGALYSTNPTWKTRVVRFLKNLTPGRGNPLSRDQKRSIKAFREAVEEKYQTAGTKILDSTLKRFRTVKVSPNVDFYRSVIRQLKE
ncbi:MAG: hypothetical protein GDA50_08085 [Alphaproteobacteria bacterium GM202ARS2]|nr:hypothetical protein [Alphaproteobacteria bacterium GM202ARS2]